MSGIGRTIADLELRNAATMRRAQAAYDGMDDDADADDELSLEDALEQAADEINANPASIMFHLGHLIGDDAESASDDALYSGDWIPDTASAGTLLAVMFEGSSENRGLARMELRDRLEARMQGDIKARAQELLAEAERERDDAAMERYLDRLEDTK